VIVVLVILAAVGIHGCQASAQANALRAYTDDVAAVVGQSDGTGRQLFSLLSRGSGSSAALQLQNGVDQARVAAQTELSRAQSFDVPSQMHGAQRDLVLALQLRRDGIADIARNIQPAVGTATARDAQEAIAADMARFYSSDVLYKDYAAPQIAAALNADGIAVGGANGETIDGGQFLPSIGWLSPSFIAARLGVATQTTSHAAVAPGLHGHALDSVSVAGTTLDTGSTNVIPASPAPTFELTFTNTGTNTESDVILKVTVSGTGISGQTVVPQTSPGQQLTVAVPLSGAPPAGSYTVTATVEKVPGEANLSNNTLTFPVTFT
jgi:hypothetical protein